MTSSDHARFRPYDPWTIPAVVLGAWAIFEIVSASTLAIEKYDGLTHLSNAWGILHGSLPSYAVDRPPGPVLLFLPAVLIGDSLPPEFRLLVPHLFALVPAAVLLVALSRLNSLSLGPGRDLVPLSLALFVTTRLMVYWPPFVMGDILGTLLAVVSLILSIRRSEDRGPSDRGPSDRGYSLLQGLILGVIVATRIVLIAPLFLLISLLEFDLLRRRARPLSSVAQVIGLVSASAIVVSFVLYAAPFLAVGAVSPSLSLPSETFDLFLNLIRRQGGHVGLGGGDAGRLIDLPLLLARSISIPLLTLSLIGIASSLRSNRGAWRIHAAWIVLVTIPLLLMRTRESRLFMPILPSLILMALAGWKVVEDILRPARTPSRLVILLLLFTLPGAIDEGRLLFSPVLRAPFLTELGRAAAESGHGGRIVFIGPSIRLIAFQGEPMGEEEHGFFLIHGQGLSYLAGAEVSVAGGGWKPESRASILDEGGVIIESPPTPGLRRREAPGAPILLFSADRTASIPPPPGLPYWEEVQADIP